MLEWNNDVIYNWTHYYNYYYLLNQYFPSPSNLRIYSWNLNNDYLCDTVKSVIFNAFALLYIIASISILTDDVHSSNKI